MAHGHPDYVNGSMLYGSHNGQALQINLDDIGNLIALLKGLYNGTPTTLACDASGNIKVNITAVSSTQGVIIDTSGGNVAVDVKSLPSSVPVAPATSGTVFKTQEQSPLSSIQIEPKSGAGSIGISVNNLPSSPISIQVQSEPAPQLSGIVSCASGVQTDIINPVPAGTYTALRVLFTLLNPGTNRGSVVFANTAIPFPGSLHLVDLIAAAVPQWTMGYWTISKNDYSAGILEATLYGPFTLSSPGNFQASNGCTNNITVKYDLWTVPIKQSYAIVVTPE